MPKKSRILVTAALPYANGPIHIGHLVEYLFTDFYVRFLKLIGKDAVYICADDTHGTPIQVNAEKLGMKPEELIEKFHKEHEEDFKKFLISFDSFYTTNSHENQHFSDLFFKKLNEKGLIYKRKIKITYCTKCKRFLPDRYIKGKCPRCGAEEQYGDICEKCGASYEPTELINPKCALCGAKPILKDSVHYFFKLSAFSSNLEAWIKENKEFQPEMKSYILNWIKQGLKDWCISRDGPYFGFKIPGEKDKYYYVWLDAPIGYIASTANYCKSHKLDVLKDYWQNKECEIIHIIGKEITYFHFLFWPAMLMGAEFNLPSSIIVHGMLTVAGEKMSKSRGTLVSAKEWIAKYQNPEYLRYYFAGLLSKKITDIDFNEADFKKNINNELVANLANFCYRTLSFINSNLDSQIKELDKKEKIIAEINEKINKIKEAYADMNFKKALELILEISAMGNSYFQKYEPWKLVKEKDGKKKTEQILALCANISKNLAILVQPILPGYAAHLEKQLNLTALKWTDLGFELKNHTIGRAEISLRKLV